MRLPNHRLLKNSCERLFQAICRYHEPDSDKNMVFGLIKRESSLLLKQAFKFWIRIRTGRKETW